MTKLTDRYGCRMVAVAGSLIASLGFIASYFAQSLYQLYITLGIMAGIGYGMIFLTSIVTVTRYFDKKRSLAMGISVCGSGIGAIIFNPLSKWLLDEYGWRGTILIEAGLVLNCVAFSALYRPLPENKPESNTEDEQIENEIALLKKDGTKEISHVENNSCIECRADLHTSYSAKPNADLSIIDDDDLNYEIRVKCNKVKIVLHKTEPNGDMNEYSSFIENSHEEAGSTEFRTKSSKSDTESKSKQCIKFSSELFRFSLLKNPSFLVFFTSSFLISVAYSVPYTYLPDLATKLGYTKSEGVLLISYLGIANTISRVIFGIIGDRPQVNRSYMYNLTNITCGLFTAFVPLFSVYGLLVMYAVVFGMTIGGYVSLSTIVAGDLFTTDVITESIGLYMLASGLAAFIGTPIAGWLFDVTGSYAVSFISTGMVLTLGGAILFLIPCIRRKKTKT